MAFFVLPWYVKLGVQPFEKEKDSTWRTARKNFPKKQSLSRRAKLWYVSQMMGKLSSPVRWEAHGKGLQPQYLAGCLPYNILKRFFARLGPHTGDPVRCADVFPAIDDDVFNTFEHI
jgi:hypothetical protein